VLLTANNEYRQPVILPALKATIAAEVTVLQPNHLDVPIIQYSYTAFLPLDNQPQCYVSLVTLRVLRRHGTDVPHVSVALRVSTAEDKDSEFQVQFIRLYHVYPAYSLLC
jgi:hypothetical protein